MLPDVKFERGCLDWADVVVFVFPLWKWGAPAMLKGYMQRVLASGAAGEHPPPDEKPSGKKALLLACGEGPVSDMTDVAFISAGFTEVLREKLEHDGAITAEYLNRLFVEEGPAKEECNDSK